MVVRLIILLLLAWLGFRIYRMWQQKQQRPRSRKRIGKDMVSCQQCGVHIPVDEAIQLNDHYYCSEKHLPR